jgi:3-methylfumaryl-CoA hydratase
MDQFTKLTLDEKILSRWIGNREQQKDRIDARPANFLMATLNNQGTIYKEGDNLPPAWHWLYFLGAAPTNQLGRDGHPALGKFLPPVALPRRMWAGGHLRFHQPIVIGEELLKTSEISNVARKSGRSGELCFVTVKHKYSANSVLKLEEDHDIVYRGESTTTAQQNSAPAAPDEHDLATTIEPTSTLLFRYSALTFNGHRIHYDLDYCRNIEGYPGLVVHAPLTTTLALDLARKFYTERHPGVEFASLRVRMISPLFHDKPFTLHLKEHHGQCDIWAANPGGGLAMRGTLELKTTGLT